VHIRLYFPTRIVIKASHWSVNVVEVQSLAKPKKITVQASNRSTDAVFEPLNDKMLVVGTTKPVSQQIFLRP
jgi:hypothetical protein